MLWANISSWRGLGVVWSGLGGVLEGSWRGLGVPVAAAAGGGGGGVVVEAAAVVIIKDIRPRTQPPTLP